MGKGPFRSFFFLVSFSLFSFLGWNNNHRLGQKIGVCCVCVYGCGRWTKEKKRKRKKKKKKKRASWTGQPNELISALLEIFPSQRGFMMVCVRVPWVGVRALWNDWTFISTAFREISECEVCGTEIGNLQSPSAPCLSPTTGARHFPRIPFTGHDRARQLTVNQPLFLSPLQYPKKRIFLLVR